MESQSPTAVVIERDYSKTWSGLPAPAGWFIEDIIYKYQTNEADGYLWQRVVGEKITVMEDVSVKDDGKRWLHVSVAKPNKKKMPTYEDVAEVRKLFVGEERECYQVFPTKDRYVNANPVLHLWCCMDEPGGVLPHFEKTVQVNGEWVTSV